MDPDLIKELREYAWKYFDRHAEQRLKTFNFYILFCGAILAGMVAIMRDDHASWLAPMLAGVLCAVSFVFWKLDQRTRVLTRHSEDALKYLENEMSDKLPDEPGGVPHRCKVFVREKYNQERGRPDEWSYTRCFGLIFFLFGWGGFLLFLVLVYMQLPDHMKPRQSTVTVSNNR